MKLGRISSPVIAIAAILLLGGAVSGLVASGAILASEAAVTPIPAPTAEAAVTPIPAPTAEPTVTPTPVPLKLPEVPDKSSPPTERSTQATRSERAAALDQGTIHTWEDDDRTIRVLLQNDLVVQKTAANTSEDVVVAERAEESVVQKQARHGPDARPVFRSESGGGLMTLPGGVLLALDPGWDDAQVEDFFSHNDISTDRISELGFLQNGFLIQTEPGFPSLEIANALAGQDGVLISSPNWSTEVEAK